MPRPKHMITVKTKREIDKARIADLLCTAFEGGSNYWYMIEEMHPPTVSEAPIYGDLGGFSHLDIPLSTDGYLMVSDFKVMGQADKRVVRLDLAACLKGLEVMEAKYPRHYGNWIADKDDAETGDVFLQCCLFGETVYG